MIEIIEVIAAIGLIILFDVKKLKKANKRMKVIIIYSFFMISSLTISILILSGNRPVSPADLIETALRSLKVIQ